MKTKNQTQPLFFRPAIIGTILLAVTSAQASNFLQTVNESGAGEDWTSAIWGSGPSVATSGNSYETPSTFFIRTPNSATPTAFPGGSLQIDAGGTLYLKNGGETSGNAANVNLLLNGGTMDYHGGFSVNGAAISGTLQVLANSGITTDQSGANAGDILLQSSLSGGANLNVTMNTNSLLLSGSNATFSGNWTNTSGSIRIVSGTTNALGSGTVTLTGSGTTPLIFNSTNNMVVLNTITGPGYIVKLNTNTVTLAGDNAFTGSVRITNGVIQIGAGSSLSNSSTIILAGGALDASLIGGMNLNPVIGQNMNCNGSVIGNLTTSTGDTNNFGLTPTTNDILNVTGSLTLIGNPTLNLTLAGYKPSGIYRLINYSGTIQGGGSFNLVPPAGSAETFALNTNTPGQVNLIVTGTTYSLTWVGDGIANDWDTTSPNWTGGSNVFSLGDNVTFDDSGSTNPAIDIDSGPVYPNSMTISNTINFYTFVDVNGIASSGSLTKLGTNEVDFANSGNAFSGPIAIQAGILSIGNGGTTGSLGTGPITNNGVLQVNLSAGGAAFNAPISGSGSLNITGGGASVTLSAANSYTGTTTIGNGCQLNISTSSALGAATSVATVLANGRLGIASFVGSMTVANPVAISGDYVSPGGALYVNTTGNNVTWSGPITIGKGNDGVVNQIRVVNVNTRMNFSNTVLGTNEALECTAGNTAGDTTSVMTFSNTISLGSSGSLLVDGLAVVVLAGTNVWGGGTTVGLSANSSFVTSSTATLLVNGRLNGGAMEVVNLATLGGSGTILDPVTVDGTLAPGPVGGIGTLTVSNSVALESDGTAVVDLDRTNSQNASLLSATSLTYGGTLTVNNIGPTNFQAGDTFTLFAGGISGVFTVTNLPALPATNLYWDTSLLHGGIIKVGSTLATSPTITSPAVSGTNFSLQVASSQSGFAYVLQATPTLAPAVWANIQTNAGTGGTLSFTNPVTSGHPQMFFRICVQ